MSFFITSVGKGDGANYGGLAGADAYCQQMAAAAGRGGARWVAYLSTQGPGAVNARDRIGTGPWFNARGQQVAANVAELHGDTLEIARLGNRINKTTALNEKGGTVNGGAATVLQLPLDSNKELKSLTVRTLANEVVVGVMAVTLER